MAKTRVRSYGAYLSYAIRLGVLTVCVTDIKVRRAHVLVKKLLSTFPSFLTRRLNSITCYISLSRAYGIEGHRPADPAPKSEAERGCFAGAEPANILREKHQSIRCGAFEFLVRRSRLQDYFYCFVHRGSLLTKRKMVN